MCYLLDLFYLNKSFLKLHLHSQIELGMYLSLFSLEICLIIFNYLYEDVDHILGPFFVV